MSDDPIERIRLHIEKHKAKVQAPFSIAGLTALLDLLKVLTADNITLTAQRDVLKGQVEELDRWKAHAIGLEHKVSEFKAEIEHLEACVTIHDRNRKELKAQVERLLAARGAVLTEALRRKGLSTQEEETEK